MINKKIVIAGGSGFIGNELIRHFGKENTLLVLTRSLPKAVNNRYAGPEQSQHAGHAVTRVIWDGKNPGAWIEALEGADLLINLSGRSVNCRYTEKNKGEIMSSRTEPVRALGEAIRECRNPPSLWINASSATIYRHATDKAQDEYTGEIQDDFSVRVCKAWEKTFFDESTPLTRKVALRMAITLGTGGVLVPYFNLLKYGLGGKQGNGKQMYSWVHAEDCCRAIEWIARHPEMKGVYNCSSPFPVNNETFMRSLREVTGYKWGLPAPAWLLKAGATLIGTETELILKSRWVIPTRLLETGFQFKYPLLKDALREIIHKTPVKHYRLF
ncbi:MAG: TIGR01777 family protein [Sphingobacteriales bacterium]|nr:TIGR01777 family protein [Sphingobacteriales bacterium]